MAANYIEMPVDGAGKKVQTWDNTISGNDVHTEAVTITDSTGTEKATSANPVRIDPTGTTVQPVDGALTNNNAAPAGTELGVLSAVANAAAPTWVEGNQVLLSVDLAGNQRVKIAAGTAVIGHVIVDSGTITTVSTVTSITNPVTVVGNAASGAAVAGNPVLVGGSDGTDARTISTNASGQLVVVGAGTAGSGSGGVLSVQGVASGVALPVSGTFYQTTQPVSIASGQVASGAFASGSIASGAIASGAIASGAIAAGAAAAGAFADGSVYVRSNAASTFPVTATIAASQTIAVTQATASSLNATVSIASAQTLATVTTVSTVTAVTAITNALPAGTNTLGSVKITDGTNVATVKAASTASVAGDTAQVVAVNPLSQPQVIGYMMDSTGVQRAISQVAFSSASSGAHTLVASSGSTKVYILSWWVSCGGTATNVNLQSHTTTTTTTGVVNMAINGGAVFPPNNGTWVTGAAGEAVDFNLSASNQVNGGATYCQF